LENVLNRRLIIVTGKGGVGKSTVAASLAKLNASFENRTAIVDLGDDNTLCRHFSLSPTTAQTEEISPHLSLHRIRPKDVVEEYICGKVHFKGIYSALFDNRFVNYFLDATPGFNEFLITSKLWDLAVQDMRAFDTVIVDAPATGHALALLEVPQIVTSAIHSGPLKHAAAKSQDLLTNAEEAGVIIVSTPEEMPTTEAIKIKNKLSQLEIATLGLAINKVSPSFGKKYNTNSFPKKHALAIECFIENMKKTEKNQKTHLASLKKHFAKHFFEVPIVKNFNDEKISDEITELLANNGN
jgi:anion-transporting  ArsA/GET3 family ATPase